MTNEKLVSWLFETKAVRVCPQNKPFWYTSGTIGPYYINTHFLYGSQEKADNLLKLIDIEKSNIYQCPLKVLEAVKENYHFDNIYKGLIDTMITFIKNNIGLNEIDYVSGGERRDWFFSLIIADLINKPHITIYKDMQAVLSLDGKVEAVSDLSGKKVLHIADLITEASSYERAWVPAIKNFNGDMKWSLVVVDRKQGGEAVLSKLNVKSFAMINIDNQLFEKALDMGHINSIQYEMVKEYILDPKSSMRTFLVQHPEFMKNALSSDEKTAERAKLCMEKEVYGKL